jgi:hypothetical protein
MYLLAVAGRCLMFISAAAIVLSACGSTLPVASVNQLDAPLFANPDTSVFGPNVGTKSYDDVQVTVSNHTRNTATITSAVVQSKGAVDVTGVYILAPQGDPPSTPNGIEETPFQSSGRPVVLLRTPVTVAGEMIDSVLVRAHLRSASGVGVVESVTLDYTILSRHYVTKFLMTTVLCGGAAGAPNCLQLHHEWFP